MFFLDLCGVMRWLVVSYVDGESFRLSRQTDAVFRMGEIRWSVSFEVEKELWCGLWQWQLLLLVLTGA